VRDWSGRNRGHLPKPLNKSIRARGGLLRSSLFVDQETPTGRACIARELNVLGIATEKNEVGEIYLPAHRQRSLPINATLSNRGVPVARPVPADSILCADFEIIRGLLNFRH